MHLFQKGWRGFVKLYLSTKNPKEFDQLCHLFLTAEEKEDLAMRYLIIEELIKGKKTQRQIAHDLDVSIAKITRGSNELKRMNRELLTYLKEKLLKSY